MTVEHGPDRGTVRAAVRRDRDGGMPQLDFLADLARRLRSDIGVIPQLLRYGLVSALALALDFSIFIALNALIAMPTFSGVVGYGFGIILHYALSSRFVFDTARSDKSAHRRFSEFVASGLIGLALTAAVIAVGTMVFGLSPLMAKVLAAGTSFIGVFVIRRTIVFA